MLVESTWSVKVADIYTRDWVRFHPLGLFSEQIFGNVRDFTCQCPQTFKPQFVGYRCPKCDVLLGPSSLRRYVVSKIELPMPIIPPQYVAYAIPVNLKKELLGDLSPDSYGVYEKALRWLEKELGVGEVTTSIPVLPPELRPITKRGSVLELSKINYYYLRILNTLKKWEEVSSTTKPPEDVRIYTKIALVRAGVELTEFLVSRLTHKEGIIRQHVLGKRNDFTARSVITVDPTLALDEVRLPYRVLCALFQLQLIVELSKHYDPVTAYQSIETYMHNPQALSSVMRSSIEELLDRITRSEYVLVNRQPTLHRVSIQAFKVKGHRADTIGISPLIRAPYNADFDGDSIYGKIRLRVNGKEMVKHIAELEDLDV